MSDQETARDEAECDRLTLGTAAAKPAGIGTDTITIRTREVRAATVFDRAREALLIVNTRLRDGRPSLEQWRKFLPTWFVERCAPELTPEEVAASRAQWDSLSWKAKLREERKELPWTLSGWIHSFDPDSADAREWRWWDSTVIDEATAEVRIEVTGWPYAWGELGWLLRVAGAEAVTTDD